MSNLLPQSCSSIAFGEVAIFVNVPGTSSGVSVRLVFFLINDLKKDLIAIANYSAIFKDTPASRGYVDQSLLYHALAGFYVFDFLEAPLQ